MEDNKKYTKMLLELVKEDNRWNWKKQDTTEAISCLKHMFANNEVDKSKISNQLIADLIDFIESNDEHVIAPREHYDFLMDFILGKQGLNLI